jgi:hypothetical protein
MTKIVYNKCFGGFSLSYEALHMLASLMGVTLYEKVDPRFPTLTSFYTSPTFEESTHFSSTDIPRTSPHLVRVVETLGERANGPYADLAICELPEGTRYRISEYDGYESVILCAL